MIHAPFAEFRYQNDDQGDAGRDCPEQIDRHGRAGPRRLVLLSPVLHHARLRQRERHERADGEQRDQVVGDAAKNNEQDAR